MSILPEGPQFFPVLDDAKVLKEDTCRQYNRHYNDCRMERPLDSWQMSFEPKPQEDCDNVHNQGDKIYWVNMRGLQKTSDNVLHLNYPFVEIELRQSVLCLQESVKCFRRIPKILMWRRHGKQGLLQ